MKFLHTGQMVHGKQWEQNQQQHVHELLAACSVLWRKDHSQMLDDCVPGRNTESAEGAEAAARTLLEEGVDSVLVKRGTRGSLLVSRKEATVNQPIFPVDKVSIAFHMWNSPV